MSAALPTPEACERGYNNRAAVPDHGDYFRRWAADSAAVRGSVRCAIDVRYGAGEKETLDLFPAPGEQRRGLIVFIHGGYWRALDKSDYSYLAPAFTAAGFDVAVVNYDLCPQVSIGTIIDECRRSVEWLARNGAAHGVAAGRMVVAGHSAGGHLAAMLHATDWAERGVDAAIIKGSVGISGVYELEPLIHTSMNPDLRITTDGAAAWSPARLQPTLSAPLLLAVGADETSEFLRQTQLQWDAWPQVRPAGSAGPTLVEGHHHFSVVDCLADPRHPLFLETLALFG